MLLDSVTAPDAKAALVLPDVKKHLRIDHDDDDDYIAELIKTAFAQAENKTRRAILTQTWDYYIDTFPGGDGEIKIPKPPLTSVTSIKYQDSSDVQQTWDSSNYVVDTVKEPGRVYLATNASYPATYIKRKAVVIRFVAGYTTIPKPIQDWMKIWILDAYDSMRQSYFTGGSFDARVMRDSTFQDNLLNNYRIYGF